MKLAVVAGAVAALGVVAVAGVGFMKRVEALRDGDPTAARAEAVRRHAEFLKSLDQPPPPVGATARAEPPVGATARAEPEPEPEPVAPPVDRTISIREMAECQIRLKDRLKDPDSYREHERLLGGGGWIDYTATNGFGGPTRAIFQCSTGINVAK
jgi:hypothetical protein